jgi:carbamoyl-phosphate synthase large subunit
MGKTLLILGGGKFQIPLIDKAKTLGLTVFVVDRDKSAPGAKKADQLIIASITDVQNILHQLLDKHIDAIATDQTDAGVTSAAQLASALGTRGIGPEIAKRFTNKILMRELLSEKGLPVPKFIKVKKVEDAYPFIHRTGFPLILKPPSSQSSKGVFLLKSLDEFIAHFSLAKKESADGYVLVEEYINGTEYTVESFVTSGQIHPLAISDKMHLQYNPCVAIRLTYPPEKYEEVGPALESMNKCVIQSLGLFFGITHAEYRIRDGIPYLIEIAARGGGTYIASDIIPAVSGIDVYDSLIRELFSVPVTFCDIQHNASILDFFQFDEGKIHKIVGIEQSRRIPGVIKIEVNLKTGDYISRISDDTTRHGFLIAAGKTREEVVAIAEEVKNTVQIIYE